MRPVLVLTAFLSILTGCNNKNNSGNSALLYAKAMSLYNEGKYSECAALLKTGKSDYFNPSLVLRGKALYFAGSDNEAENVLREALKKRPDAAEAALFLARILRETNRHEEAITLITRVLENDPSDIRALRLAAKIESDKGPGGNAAAISLLDRAVHQATETALVFIDRARLRWRAGNGEGALDDLRTAKELSKESEVIAMSVENLRAAITEAVR